MSSKAGKLFEFSFKVEMTTLGRFERDVYVYPLLFNLSGKYKNMVFSLLKWLWISRDNSIAYANSFRQHHPMA